VVEAGVHQLQPHDGGIQQLVQVVDGPELCAPAVAREDAAVRGQHVTFALPVVGIVNTLDTVAVDTPAALAISVILFFINLTITRSNMKRLHTTFYNN
jgi:hypothetical protein